MSVSHETLFHKELCMFNCFFGYFGLNHHCNRKIKSVIKISSCLKDYKLCEKEVDRKEYISFRWKKMSSVMMSVVLVMIN